jgi:hypothetical protein
VRYVRSRSADRISVNSTDRHNITAKSKLSITDAALPGLEYIDLETSESDAPPNTSLSQVYVSQSTAHNACSVVTLGNNYFHVEVITTMAVQILADLQWKSIIIFYENSTGKVKLWLMNYMVCYSMCECITVIQPHSFHFVLLSVYVFISIFFFQMARS